MSDIKIVYVEFPEEFANIQSYEKEGVIIINFSFSGESCEPLYKPLIHQ